MTYIYDLLINLSKYGYNFYEWKETDNIEYLKKSILIKTSDYIYKKIISNNIVLGDNTLNLFKNKSCVLKNKKIETIPYMAVFTNGKDSIGVMFSSDGKILSTTRFMIQDELELLENAKDLKTVRINYKEISNKKMNISFNSREEKEIINHIVNSLESIKNDTPKIEYLYYEWFNKKSDSINTYNELINDINKNYTDEKKEFLQLLDLVTIKNNV